MLIHNELLYGKAKSHKAYNIVSIEIKDDVAELYCQDEDGSVYKNLEGNKFWIVANQNPNSWHRLQGDLYYKYGKQFTSREDFQKTKSMMKHKETFSIYDPKESFMVLKGYTYYQGLKPKDVTILSFDIETTSLELDSSAKVLLISNTFRKNNVITRKLFDFKEYADEGEMIQDWCKWVREMDPSIICGHNINMFDLPYIRHVANRYDIDLNLGRDGSAMRAEGYESKFRKDGSQFYSYHKHRIYGREIVDTLFLALKYDVGRKYESYGLKRIIEQEGLEVADRQFYDASKIRFNYNNPEEWRKIKKYAEFDADDALALFDLMSSSYFYSAQIIPKSFQSITESATGSQINAVMIRSYLQNGHSLPKGSESVDFEGAISLGNPGIYRNVFKVDVASLYPSIMIQYEVYDPEKDPNANFLGLVQQLTEQRLSNKKLAKETGDRYYHDLEQSQKVLINSCYGFLGAQKLLFNSPEKAAFITRKGREILQQAIDWSQSRGYKLVNADTDSISFSKGDESHFTKEERTEALVALNALFPEKINFEDDGYYKTLIVVKAKNYIMQTEDGQIKYKGSAIKATNKEPALKQFIKDIIESIFNGKQNYVEIYNTYVKEILKIEDIKRWASKKTITSKVLENTRTNEAKVRDAIAGSEYAEGDKIYTYYNGADELKLAEHFDGDYNKDKLFDKLHKTALTFETIIDKSIFLNYKLKRNKKLLDELS